MRSSSLYTSLHRRILVGSFFAATIIPSAIAMFWGRPEIALILIPVMLIGAWLLGGYWYRKDIAFIPLDADDRA